MLCTWECVPNTEQLVVPPTYTPYSIGSQFPTMIQPMTNKGKQPVQQPITAPIPTIV